MKLMVVIGFLISLIGIAHISVYGVNLIGAGIVVLSAIVIILSYGGKGGLEG